MRICQLAEAAHGEEFTRARGVQIPAEAATAAAATVADDGDDVLSQQDVLAFCNSHPDILESFGVFSVQEL